MFSGTGSFTFPIGDNTGTAEYSPYTVNFTSGAFSSGYVTARVVDAKHPNNSSTTNYITRYWPITSSGITAFSCDIQGYYTVADIVGSESNMTCAEWNGSSWYDLATAPNATDHKILGTVTSFGDFTAGEAIALPVELTSFSASVISNKVFLKWRTATEVNNYGFSVERKAGNDWMEIGFVAGQGTVNTPQQYTFIDDNPVRLQEIFYRLKQMDRDGSISYSAAVLVKFNGTANMALDQNYPNPFGASALSGNQATNISFTLDQARDVKLNVYDITGKLIARLASGMHQKGNYVIPFSAGMLPAGAYYYVLESADKNIVKQMQLIK